MAGAPAARFVCLLSFLALLATAGCQERPAGTSPPVTASLAPDSGPAPADRQESPERITARPAAATSPGSGFVLWESNRGGEFRIWRAELANPNGGARQISPDEPGRDHCCAKISPDGRRMVYLSLPGGARGYEIAAVGALHLADADGGRDRVLVAEARHYGEHRAAVWWRVDEIVHLDGGGATVRRVLSTGESETLARPGSRGEGWLIAPGGHVATGNTPTFSGFDPGRGVEELPSLGGCQPAFTADGSAAVWSAGAGGPIDAIDLATRESRSLLRKNDPRLPEGKRYVYFPQLSADSTLLAVAASDGTHDHFAADYDVLVLELDPATLEPRADAIVVAPHPAVDRFPDPYRGPTGAARASISTPGTRPAPARASGLALLWERGDSANRVAPGAPATLATARGLAWLDRRRAMALGGGRFEADAASAERLASGLRDSNQLTLALRLEPATLDQSGTLIALSNGGRQRALVLRQNGRALELTLRTSDTPREGRSVRVAELSSTGPTHLLISFSPGRLSAYVGGKPAGAAQPFPGDFFSWRPAPLSFGLEPGENHAWRGTIADVAFWNRPLSAAEAGAEAERSLAAGEGAGQVERLLVEARILNVSPTPALTSISPYREALAVDQIEIVRRISGPEIAGKTIRRVRWTILDGETLPSPRPGEVAMLALEPFAAQPQLEPFYLGDRTGSDAPLWFDLGATVAP